MPDPSYAHDWYPLYLSSSCDISCWHFLTIQALMIAIYELQQGVIYLRLVIIALVLFYMIAKTSPLLWEAPE